MPACSSAAAAPRSSRSRILRWRRRSRTTRRPATIPTGASSALSARCSRWSGAASTRHSPRRARCIASIRGSRAASRKTSGVIAVAIAYDATDRGALLWVHATLWESSITMHETLLGPLAPETKERYYQETKRFAGLFGLDGDELPADWTAFLTYHRRMWESDELAVGAVGREIAGYLFASSDPVLEPAAAWLRTLTAGAAAGRGPRAIRPRARRRRAAGLRAFGPAPARLAAASSGSPALRSPVLRGAAAHRRAPGAGLGRTRGRARLSGQLFVEEQLACSPRAGPSPAATPASAALARPPR